MPRTALVRAKDGRKVPRDDNARRYIDGEPVRVTMSTYYLRRIAAGELEEVEDKPSPPSPPVKVIAPPVPAVPVGPAKDKE